LNWYILLKRGINIYNYYLKFIYREDNEKNEIFFLSSEGSIEKVKEIISKQPELINKKDENVIK